MADKEPTKDDKFIARIGLISSMNRTGDISNEDALQKIGWLVDEYENGSPIDGLRRIFGHRGKDETKK
jgi:hypothetical protein